MLLDLAELIIAFLQYLYLILSAPQVTYPKAWDDTGYAFSVLALGKDIFGSNLDFFVSDHKVYFTIIAVLLPLLLIFIGLIALNPKRNVLWFFAFLVGLWFLMAGIAASLISDFIGESISDDEALNMIIVGCLILAVCVVALVIQYATRCCDDIDEDENSEMVDFDDDEDEEMKNDNEKSPTKDTNDSSLQQQQQSVVVVDGGSPTTTTTTNAAAADNSPNNNRAHTAASGKNTNKKKRRGSSSIAITALLSRDEAMKKETKDFNWTDQVEGLAVFVVLLFIGLVFIEAIPPREVGLDKIGLGNSSVLKVLFPIGIVFLIMSVVAVGWSALGWFERGRRIRWQTVFIFETNAMWALLILMSLLYMPITSAVFVMFNCNPLTCESGSRILDEGSTLVPYGNDPQEGCLPCTVSDYSFSPPSSYSSGGGLSNASLITSPYPSMFSASMNGAQCAAAMALRACGGSTSNRLEASVDIPCSRMQGYFFPAAGILIAAFIIGLPLLFFRTIQQSSSMVRAVVPAAPGAANDDEQWESQLSSTQNVAKFLYQPTFYRFRFLRLYEIARRFITTIVSTYIFRTTFSSGYIAIYVSLGVHALTTVLFILLKPHIDTHENRTVIACSATLVGFLIFAAVSMENTEALPYAVFLIVLVCALITPAVCLGYGLYLWWKKRQSAAAEQQLLDERQLKNLIFKVGEETAALEQEELAFIEAEDMRLRTRAEERRLRRMQELDRLNALERGIMSGFFNEGEGGPDGGVGGGADDEDPEERLNRTANMMARLGVGITVGGGGFEEGGDDAESGGDISQGGGTALRGGIDIEAIAQSSSPERELLNMTRTRKSVVLQADDFLESSDDEGSTFWSDAEDEDDGEGALLRGGGARGRSGSNSNTNTKRRKSAVTIATGNGKKQQRNKLTSKFLGGTANSSGVGGAPPILLGTGGGGGTSNTNSPFHRSKSNQASSASGALHRASIVNFNTTAKSSQLNSTAATGGGVAPPSNAFLETTNNNTMTSVLMGSGGLNSILKNTNNNTLNGGGGTTDDGNNKMSTTTLLGGTSTTSAIIAPVEGNETNAIAAGGGGAEEGGEQQPLLLMSATAGGAGVVVEHAHDGESPRPAGGDDDENKADGETAEPSPTDPTATAAAGVVAEGETNEQNAADGGEAEAAAASVVNIPAPPALLSSSMVATPVRPTAITIPPASSSTHAHSSRYGASGGYNNDPITGTPLTKRLMQMTTRFSPNRRKAKPHFHEHIEKELQEQADALAILSGLGMGGGSISTAPSAVSTTPAAVQNKNGGNNGSSTRSDPSKQLLDGASTPMTPAAAAAGGYGNDTTLISGIVPLSPKLSPRSKIGTYDVSHGALYAGDNVVVGYGYDNGDQRYECPEMVRSTQPIIINIAKKVHNPFGSLLMRRSSLLLSSSAANGVVDHLALTARTRKSRADYERHKRRRHFRNAIIENIRNETNSVREGDSDDPDDPATANKEYDLDENGERFIKRVPVAKFVPAEKRHRKTVSLVNPLARRNMTLAQKKSVTLNPSGGANSNKNSSSGGNKKGGNNKNGDANNAPHQQALVIPNGPTEQCFLILDGTLTIEDVAEHRFKYGKEVQVAVAKDADIRINRQVKNTFNLWLMIAGFLGFVALGFSFMGLLDDPVKVVEEPNESAAATSSNELVGYTTWENFTQHCCCVPYLIPIHSQDLDGAVAEQLFPSPSSSSSSSSRYSVFATNHNASLANSRASRPSGAEGAKERYTNDIAKVEKWVCENGRVKERVRAYRTGDYPSHPNIDSFIPPLSHFTPTINASVPFADPARFALSSYRMVDSTFDVRPMCGVQFLDATCALSVDYSGKLTFNCASLADAHKRLW